MFRKELRQNDLNLKDCRKLFKDVNKIIHDFLLEVFVKNEKNNFRKLVQNALLERQFKPKLKIPHLRRKSLKIYETFIKIFIENLMVIKEIYLNKEVRVKDSAYVKALNELFDELTATAKGMLDQEIFDTILAGDYPPCIFRDIKAIWRFIKIHWSFVNKMADLAYLYRKMVDEKLIVAKDPAFRDWYNSWEDRKFHADDYFKTFEKVKTTARESLYDTITANIAKLY